MKYVILRSIQILSLLIVLSGLAKGIGEKNVTLEINALIIGSGLFYLANLLLKKN
tara:strand:+ start:4646 stop:4810 length:165 start_codon:yes stop_codon:yes gene_type:complete